MLLFRRHGPLVGAKGGVQCGDRNGAEDDDADAALLGDDGGDESAAAEQLAIEREFFALASDVTVAIANARAVQRVAEQLRSAAGGRRRL